MAHKAARDPKEHTENMDALTEALSPIRERLDVHGEMLNRILQILTEEKESDGPPSMTCWPTSSSASTTRAATWPTLPRRSLSWGSTCRSTS